MSATNVKPVQMTEIIIISFVMVIFEWYIYFINQDYILAGPLQIPRR